MIGQHPDSVSLTGCISLITPDRSSYCELEGESKRFIEDNGPELEKNVYLMFLNDLLQYLHNIK